MRCTFPLWNADTLYQFFGLTILLNSVCGMLVEVIKPLKITAEGYTDTVGDSTMYVEHSHVPVKRAKRAHGIPQNARRGLTNAHWGPVSTHGALKNTHRTPVLTHGTLASAHGRPTPLLVAS